jgi:hypothetical protein
LLSASILIDAAVVAVLAVVGRAPAFRTPPIDVTLPRGERQRLLPEGEAEYRRAKKNCSGQARE